MTTVAPPVSAPEAKKGRAPVHLDLGPRRVLNIKLLVITLIGLVVFGVAGYFWHEFMVDRTAGVFLARATQLEEEGNLNQSSRYIGQYLRVHPSDVDVRIRLAEINDKMAKDNPKLKQRTKELYNQVVGIAPDRIDLRSRLAELMLELAQMGDRRQLPAAESQANEILQRDSKNLIGLRVLALSSYMGAKANVSGSKPMDAVVTLFERGLKLHPEDVEMARTLAYLYRNDLKQPSQEERNEMANGVMDRLTKAAPDNPQAFLALFIYRNQYNLPEAQEAIDKSVALGPENIDVLLTAGEYSLNSAVQARTDQHWDDATNFFQQAEKYYARAVKIDKTNERAQLGLGHAQMVQGKAGLAIETWKNGLKEVGRANLDLNFQIVRAMIQLGQYDDVEKTLSLLELELEKIITRLSQSQQLYARSQINYLRGKLYAGRGEWQKVIAVLKQVLVAWDAQVASRTSKRTVLEYYDAAMGLGRAYGELGEWDLAEKEFTRALVARPEATEAMRALIDVLQRLGRHDRAKAIADKLEQYEGASPELWLQTVEAELRRQVAQSKAERNWKPLRTKFDTPPEQLRRSWQLQLLKADYVLAYGGEKSIDNALQFLAAAEKLSPESPDLYQRLTLAYERLGKPEESDRALAKLGVLEGGSLRFSMVKAERYVLRRQYAEAKKLLEGLITTTAGPDKVALKQSMYRLNLQMGDFASAKQILTELQKDDPKNVTLVNQMADMLLNYGQQKELEPWTQQMRDLEGKETSRWRYFEAERLLAIAKDKNDPVIAQAIELQHYVENHRSTWPEAYLLKGDVAIRQENYDDAIKAYQTAIDLGDGRLSTFEKLIQLLYTAKRFDDAEKVGSPGTELEFAL